MTRVWYILVAMAAHFWPACAKGAAAGAKCRDLEVYWTTLSVRGRGDSKSTSLPAGSSSGAGFPACPGESDARGEGRDDEPLSASPSAFSFSRSAATSAAGGTSTTGSQCSATPSLTNRSAQPKGQGEEGRRSRATASPASGQGFAGTTGTVTLAALVDRVAAVRCRADYGARPSLLGQPMGQDGALDPPSLSSRRYSAPVGFHLPKTVHVAPVACPRWLPPSSWAGRAGSVDDAAWGSSSPRSQIMVDKWRASVDNSLNVILSMTDT